MRNSTGGDTGPGLTRPHFDAEHQAGYQCRKPRQRKQSVPLGERDWETALNPADVFEALAAAPKFGSAISHARQQLSRRGVERPDQGKIHDETPSANGGAGGTPARFQFP